MNTNRKTENSFLIFILLPYLSLVLLHIILSLPMKVPIIWPDEFAYLFFGKHIAGYEIMYNIPKIELISSFGYSVLFSPIFMLFKEPSQIYSSILILNSIISATLYIGLYLLLKNLFNAGSKTSFLVAFVVCFYPAYLLQTDVVLTDAVTPALFTFGILLFNNFIRKKSVLYSILFALAAGYLNWVHIRMLPFTIMSIIFLCFLVYYKKMPIFQAGLSIIIMIIMILFGIIIGDHLTYMLSGAVGKSQRISESLIRIAEIILIFLLIGCSLYFLVRKYYLHMTYTAAGLVGGILASTSFTALLLFPVAGLIYLLILHSLNKIKFSYGVWAFASMSVIAFFTYFVLPDFGYYTVVSERILIWFINASGSLFYALFSTYCLFLMGVFFIVRHIWINSVEIIPAVSHTDLFREVKKNRFSIEKMLNDYSSLTLTFLMSAAFLMIFITIMPTKYQISYYRADHLFYGRYVEVVLACFLAIAIYKLKEAEVKDFLISSLGAWFVFIVLTIVMIITYDNIIPSELSFRSVMSFFPLRAVLGNINIMLYFIAALFTSVMIAICYRYNPPLGRFVIISAFLSFTIFTYIYVDYYHQVEKIYRNKLVNYLNEIFPDQIKISYDKKIFKENSQNGLSYLWLMPKRMISFFDSDKTLPETNLIIAGNDYGLKSKKKAVLLNIEHDGNDHLWMSTDQNNSYLSDLMPSYYNIPLNKSYVGGVYRNGFHKDKWINGKAEINTYINKPDSVFSIEFEIISTTLKPQNLIIWLENKEIFNKNIANGGWKYSLNIKLDTIFDRLNFKFFSDLSRENKNRDLLRGIIIKNFMIKDSIIDMENSLTEDLSKVDPSNENEINYTVYPRRNIDFSQLDLNSGDSIEVPMVIRNNSNNPLVFNNKTPIHLMYFWDDFIFKNEVMQEFAVKNINTKINAGEEKEFLVKIKSPSENKKFFLTFALVLDDQTKIKQFNNREYLFNFKK